jgi:carbamoyl-phosphate synthase small subunit
MESIRLTLEDGTTVEGQSFGKSIAAAGEVVFNTGMVGYPETLTDPSYRGQILVLTYPLVGNYGVPEMKTDERGLPVGFESQRIQAAGLIVTEYCARYSHYTAVRSLGEWLVSEGVPAITGVDTRMLTKRLREKGTMLGKIETAKDETGFVDPNVTNLVGAVSAKETVKIDAMGEHGAGRRPKIALIDCGCKASIVRSLLVRGMDVVRIPHDEYFLGLDFDGVLISNGPGDPRLVQTTVRHVEHALAVGKPIFGICLGHQVLALAAGAETYKLKFGHRSQNQPCQEVVKGGGGRCVITSQNHGYAVREKGLPPNWRVWFANVNDNTVEGIRHVSKPFYSVQFHPEATPGPTDTAWLFDDFAADVRKGMR